MKILEFLNGSGGMILIGSFVVTALIIKHFKKRRYFREMDRRHGNKK